jgi:hypothetical protein
VLLLALPLLLLLAAGFCCHAGDCGWCACLPLMLSLLLLGELPAAAEDDTTPNFLGFCLLLLLHAAASLQLLLTARRLLGAFNAGLTPAMCVHTWLIVLQLHRPCEVNRMLLMQLAVCCGPFRAR